MQIFVYRSTQNIFFCFGIFYTKKSHKDTLYNIYFYWKVFLVIIWMIEIYKKNIWKWKNTNVTWLISFPHSVYVNFLTCCLSFISLTTFGIQPFETVIYFRSLCICKTHTHTNICEFVWKFRRRFSVRWESAENFRLTFPVSYTRRALFFAYILIVCMWCFCPIHLIYGVKSKVKNFPLKFRSLWISRRSFGRGKWKGSPRMGRSVPNGDNFIL